jgi:hypothetical protein
VAITVSSLRLMDRIGPGTRQSATMVVRRRSSALNTAAAPTPIPMASRSWPSQPTAVKPRASALPIACCTRVPVSGSQSTSVQASSTAASRLPSGENATPLTAPSWAGSTRTGTGSRGGGVGSGLRSGDMGSGGMRSGGMGVGVTGSGGRRSGGSASGGRCADRSGGGSGRTGTDDRRNTHAATADSARAAAAAAGTTHAGRDAPGLDGFDTARRRVARDSACSLRADDDIRPSAIAASRASSIAPAS